MLYFIRYYFTFLAFCFFIGCGSSSKKDSSSGIDKVQFQKIKQAFQLMEQKQFQEAAHLYDSLAKISQDPSVQILAIYNSGVAYKSAGDCKSSLSRFRSVLEKSFRDLERYQAISLLEISLVYECLGQNENSLSSLKDLEKKFRFLTLDSQRVIYLGRLSLALSKKGDFEKANQYQSSALSQVLVFKKSLSQESLKEELSRLFYLLGKSYVKKEYLEVESFVASFVYHQNFLLQSLFLEHDTWSVEARKGLDKLFANLIVVLSQTENPKKYKKRVENSLKLGASMVKKEKAKTWKKYYEERATAVEKVFSRAKSKSSSTKPVPTKPSLAKSSLAKLNLAKSVPIK